MAKRSKKKNPMLLSGKDRENIEFNNSLDKQKNLWGKKLNITLGIVIGVVFLCLILLPVFNMSFTRSLSALVGSTELEEDADFTMVTELSFLDILTALAGGYEDSIQYIAHNNNSNIDAETLEDLFRKFVENENIDIKMLDNAYYVSLFITIAAIIVFVLFVIIVSVYRSKNKDGIMLGISIVLMFAISMIQFLFFAIVGLSAADKGELQPHIGSYFMLFAGTTIFVVYIIYRIKIKKLNNQYRQVPAISQGIVEEK